MLFCCFKTFSNIFLFRVSNPPFVLSVSAEREINLFCFNSFRWKGGENMKPYSFENTIRLQFDCLARKVIGRTVNNYNKELFRRSMKEVPFCELPNQKVCQ